jgi:single-strand DNA-binding protein
MSNLNRIIIVGRINSPVELKYTAEGTAMATFSLVAERPRREGSPPKTDAISIIAWNKLAEICAEYLDNGKLALVEGRIQVRTYDADNGRRKYVTEVVAQNMRILEGSVGDLAEEQASQQHATSGSISQPTEKKKASEEQPQSVETGNDGPFYTEDDIPF